MKQIVLTRPHEFQMTEAAGPGEPGPGEAIVRVHRVGICGSDLHAFRGQHPFVTCPVILGHELGVVIEQINGEHSGLAVGDRCAVEPYLNCGRCVACRRGRTNCCADLKVLGIHTDGGMRERFSVLLAKLHRSDTVGLEQLALVETLGIGAHAVDRARPDDGENVLVIGAGPIGMAVVQFALLRGANVLAMDINPQRLRFVSDRFGVEHLIDARDRPLAAVSDTLGGELPTVVFDATGNRDSMTAAFGLVEQTGRLAMVGIYAGDLVFNDPEFHRRELTVLACRNATAGDFKRIIGLIDQGRIDTSPWITHRATADQMIGRFTGWLDPAAGVVKAMVSFED